jgi:hypothetical protein
MAITHAAQTESVTFLLDESGICFAVVATPSAPPESFARARGSAERCVGAQYVASVDVTTAGGLVAMPREGTPLVFAAIDGDGRVALVRTGPLVRFVTSTTVSRRPHRPSRDRDREVHAPPASTMRGQFADPHTRETCPGDHDVVTLRPLFVPSVSPPTLAWGVPRPVDTEVDVNLGALNRETVSRDAVDREAVDREAGREADREAGRDTLDLVESAPFSLRRRVSDVVPRGTAYDADTADTADDADEDLTPVTQRARAV